jgi:hypothetical protein
MSFLSGIRGDDSESGSDTSDAFGDDRLPALGELR